MLDTQIRQAVQAASTATSDIAVLMVHQSLDVREYIPGNEPEMEAVQRDVRVALVYYTLKEMSDAGDRIMVGDMQAIILPVEGFEFSEVKINDSLIHDSQTYRVINPQNVFVAGLPVMCIAQVRKQ